MLYICWLISKTDCHIHCRPSFKRANALAQYDVLPCAVTLTQYVRASRFRNCSPENIALPFICELLLWLMSHMSFLPLLLQIFWTGKPGSPERPIATKTTPGWSKYMYIAIRILNQHFTAAGERLLASSTLVQSAHCHCTRYFHGCCNINYLPGPVNMTLSEWGRSGSCRVLLNIVITLLHFNHWRMNWKYLFMLQLRVCTCHTRVSRLKPVVITSSCRVSP